MKLPEVKKPVIYFCSEFAIDNELPTYSGGLGILAADVIHQAALEHFPMVGIGILYKGKEFMQHITGEGREEKRDSEFDHDTSFLRPTTKNGVTLELSLPWGKSEAKFKAYHIRLSDTAILFFLSTDVDGNPAEWVSDMDALYKGDKESQIRQQILLGIGGIKLLKALDIAPNYYHINEGRAAFCIWEITKQKMEGKAMSFEDSWKEAKEKIIYTNHTLVAAGNPTYPTDLIERYANPLAESLGIDTNLLIKDGVTDPGTFSISRFALNISAKQTAVSRVHGDYCKKEYPNYKWIAITNGVHLPRWQDSDFRKEIISDRQIWDLHMTKKKELVETVIQRTGFGYDPERLVITWARRLAEYKQPKIIFTDLERLKKIVENSTMPVQLLFAGNTHSADPNAKSIIEEIIKIFSTELSGHAIFVPNYNVSLANHLTSGSDIWLNTPQGNLEACGTSGMKAISNGVLNCTVLDGWTYEVDWEGAGWVLDPKNVAENLYDLLEKEITPLFYTRNADGLPDKWIGRMRESITFAKKFGAERMLEDYKKYLYT